MSEITDRLNNRISESIRVTIELGYIPTAFMQMFDDLGGVETATRLVSSGEIQAGFRRLVEMGRRDLTIEQIMLEPEFESEFSARLRDAARWRLGQLG